MTETNETDGGENRLELARPKKLELKKTVEIGQIRQKFSGGRSGIVQVEKMRTRIFAEGATGRMREVKAGSMDQALAKLKAAELDGDTPSKLTSNEHKKRLEVLEESKRRDERRVTEKAEAAAEVAKVKAEAAAVTKSAEVEPEEVPRAEPGPGKDPAEAVPVPPSEKPNIKTAPEDGRARKTPWDEPAKKTAPRKGNKPHRREDKLTVPGALPDEERFRSRRGPKWRDRRDRQKAEPQGPIESRKVVREVTLPETITVQELANRMAERASTVIKILVGMNVTATINQTIDADTAELVIVERGHTVKRVSESDVEDGLRGEDDAPESKRPRPPVVTVMGHVDHGKTSLLDAMRSTDVAGHEAGGITQHIGACQVQMAGGERITFIDTPGHAAFTEMRSRGAQVTDIVVLCVAADDGVMPQTIEAIRHARAAGVPLIVAINKIDLPGADASRVKQALLHHEVVVEDMGGEILTVEVSAKDHTNLDKLEEAILLQAELLDLTANPDRSAEGVVVESRMEQGRGPVATILVQRGTLNIGDLLVAGGEWGRVKAMTDERGNKIESAGPGVPVEVLGLNGVPLAGDDVSAVDSESRAREVTEYRQRRMKDTRSAKVARGTLEQMFEKIREGDKETLPVVVKADMHGSVEALTGAFESMNNDEVSIEVLHGAIGGINESDVTLANASGALIIGFNVRANPQAREHARRDGVEIRYYSIIYNAIDDLKQALSGMLAPEIREVFIGYARILEVFSVSRVGKVAGCVVTEGLVKRGAKVRLLRDDVVIHEGDLSQLKRFKNDAREVREGTECGMAFANYQDLQTGDIIECFEVKEIAREL